MVLNFKKKQNWLLGFQAQNFQEMMQTENVIFGYYANSTEALEIAFFPPFVFPIIYSFQNKYVDFPSMTGKVNGLKY